MTAHLRVSDEVIESTVGDNVILLHLGSGLYYTLDPTAVAIWRHIKAGTSLEAIVGLLAAEFKANTATIEADVQKFLGDLFTNNILQRM